MHYGRWLGTALILLLMMSGLVAVRPHAQTTLTISVVERAENDVVTDLGEEGDSVGDVLTFANAVYDETNTTQVGTDNGYCVRTVVGAAWECSWTLLLEDGSIVVAGPFNDTGDSVLAITGGTGAYANARGSMTLRFRDEAGTEFDFIYELVE
jgi:allene oxide cyclase